MAKKQKTDFFNKASFGFFICLTGKEKWKKLNRETLLIASEIGNLLSYREKLTQNTYIGSFSEFCGDIPTETVVKASRDLIRAGYIKKSLDGKLSLCSDYLEFKQEIELKIEAKELSDFPNKEDPYELFKDYKDITYYDLCTWQERIDFLKYQIQESEPRYSNFHNGIYKIIFGRLIFKKYFWKNGPGKLHHDDDFLEHEKEIVLSLYFNPSNKPKYQCKDYLRAKKHLDFFITKTIKEYDQKKIDSWESLKERHPEHCNKVEASMPEECVS